MISGTQAPPAAAQVIMIPNAVPVLEGYTLAAIDINAGHADEIPNPMNAKQINTTVVLGLSRTATEANKASSIPDNKNKLLAL